MDQQWLRETLALAQANQAQGYEQLLSAYGPRLYGYFFRATGNHHDAEDLLGELALRLVRTLKDYDERGRFEPWLFRIASNMVRDRIRRRTSSPITASLSGADGEQDDEPAAVAPVDQRLIEQEVSVELREALDRLEPVTRDMILLRHFGDLSFKEIAGLYGCPLGTALARVHRGLKALRRLMGEDNGER